MKIGELRHTIYIQTPTTSQSSRGAESVAWSDSPVLRAKVRTVSGDERTRDDQLIAFASHEITMRWPLPAGETITTKSRVRWVQDGESRYFGITAIGEPDNRMRLIVLTCYELVGEDRVL